MEKFLTAALQAAPVVAAVDKRRGERRAVVVRRHRPPRQPSASDTFASTFLTSLLSLAL